MHTRNVERRQQRSRDPHTALSLQLARVRDEASLSALVLATEDGLLIAHAGEAELCSELAALAPIVSSRGALPDNTDQSWAAMHVQAVSWQGAPLYLASCSASPINPFAQPISSLLAHAQAGVARILAA